MRRIKFLKSQEELQSNLFCLKRELMTVLNENQLLKVKIRKLNNELQKKDKQMEYLIDSRKENQFRRSVCDKEANLILKLRERNSELESMLLEKDLQNQKYCNEIKTMYLYGGHRDCKDNDRERTRIHSPVSGNRLNTIAATNLSSDILSDMHNSSRGSGENMSKNMSCTTVVKDKSKISHSNLLWIEMQKLSKMVKALEKEQNIDKQIIHLKNAEIIKLSTELKDTKERFSGELKKLLSANKITKSSFNFPFYDKNLLKLPLSFKRVGKSYYLPFQPAGSSNKKHKTTFYCNRSEQSRYRFSSKNSPEINISQITDKPANFLNELQTTRLDTVQEQTEETLSNVILKKPSDTSVIKKAETSFLPHRNKTQIEYVFDSEVSSDGEDICLTSNLRSFLQKVVTTVSSESEDNFD